MRARARACVRVCLCGGGEGGVCVCARARSVRVSSWILTSHQTYRFIGGQQGREGWGSKDKRIVKAGGGGRKGDG